MRRWRGGSASQPADNLEGVILRRINRLRPGMLLLASSLHRATGIFEISLETLPFEIERVPPYGRCMAQLSPPAHIHRRTSAGRRNGNQCREEGACALRHRRRARRARASLIVPARTNKRHHHHQSLVARAFGSTCSARHGARAREARCQAHCRQTASGAGKDHHRRSCRARSSSTQPRPAASNISDSTCRYASPDSDSDLDC